jgi:hypothetical protein
VPTYSLVKSPRIMRYRYVIARQDSQKGRQRSPLLERGGEPPRRRRACGSAAYVVSGRPLEVLLYDLTSTYFESDPPLDENENRRHGYSRDHRFDCMRIVIALIVRPDGLPLAYSIPEVRSLGSAGARHRRCAAAGDEGPIRAMPLFFCACAQKSPPPDRGEGSCDQIDCCHSPSSSSRVLSRLANALGGRTFFSPG